MNQNMVAAEWSRAREAQRAAETRCVSIYGTGWLSAAGHKSEGDLSAGSLAEVFDPPAYFQRKRKRSEPGCIELLPTLPGPDRSIMRLTNGCWTSTISPLLFMRSLRWVFPWRSLR